MPAYIIDAVRTPIGRLAALYHRFVQTAWQPYR